MPELPEVETIRLQLEKQIIGKEIQKIEIFQNRSFKGDQQSILNTTINQLLRIGKYLILVLSPVKFVVMHLKMSGRILLESPDSEKSKHLKACFYLSSNLRLDFQDVRKFGTVWILDSIDSLQNQMGVDPISDYFLFPSFCEVVEKRKRSALKPFLLDQKNIAGIGNIYADEICFVSGISPFATLEHLKDDDLQALFYAIKEILKAAIQKQGTSLGKGLSNFKTPHGEIGRNYDGLKVYGQQGLNCLRCGHMIQKCKFASRGTHFCPKCQPDLRYESSYNRR